MASPSPLLPTLARRLSFGSSQASSSLLPATSSSSSRRSISSSAPLCERRPDEWTYPSIEGDNKPRRPFLNPDISEKIPNEVAIRAGLKPYRLPSQSLDVYEVPPKLNLKYEVLTHCITFTAYEPESLRPYGAMTRHVGLALLVPVRGPRALKPVLQRWASNKSPFVHSGSKQVFERRTYQTEMDIYDADDKAVEVMVKILLASGRGEHVKVNVQKFSRGSFQLESNSSTTAPLTHSTKRMNALVQEMADRFIKDETARIEQEKQAKGAQAAFKADANHVSGEGSPAEVAVSSTPTPSPSATGEERLPAFAGLNTWRKHLKKEASAPHTRARKELDSRPPSHTLQIFVNAPPAPDTPSPTDLLSAEHLAELIRPNLHITSTFQISSEPLAPASLTSSSTLPPPPSLATLPPYTKARYLDEVTDPDFVYKSPNDHLIDHTRAVSAQYQPLPGTGSYYLAQFPTVEEAQRVRAALDDQVFGDGTVVDVWFEGAEETGEVAWSEKRGTGKGEDFKARPAAQLESVAEEQEVSPVVEEVREGIEATEETAGEVKEPVGEKVEDVKESLSSGAVAEKAEDVKAAEPVEKASSFLENVVEKAQEAKKAVVEKAEDVKEAMVDKVAEAKEQVADALEVADEKAEEAKTEVEEKVEEMKEKSDTPPKP